jgi:DNA-binding NarL/FixJ family response regulator
MTRVFVADPQPDVRAGLRLLLLDLGMEVIGEAADWSAILALLPELRPQMLLIDSELIGNGSASGLNQLRAACPAVVIVLISHRDARQQAALSVGADAFISKGETPDRVAERLRDAAGIIRSR